MALSKTQKKFVLERVLNSRYGVTTWQIYQAFPRFGISRVIDNKKDLSITPDDITRFLKSLMKNELVCSSRDKRNKVYIWLPGPNLSEFLNGKITRQVTSFVAKSAMKFE